ncbi:GNAT family N-acetyltransferase [Chitinophaga silvatica]|uniref:GNAT family N-acetyltransferase n=1 Tax=Chitinophaga silvatica TaxID=2282649 RepID=A0A3E1YHA4_9BACT|nr:GNAT family N-acetyltransferase [Chitinophaga silvatica]RFS26756.1 GNAT family N-acetyltransferase [Chitinophaga silvatica]
MDHFQSQVKSGTYSIRQLNPNEAQLYKAIRLEAIRTEPSMFRCSTPAEEDLSDAQWQERVVSPRSVFGLYENDTIIGMTSILLLNEQEAFLGQSYIRKEFRGKGLASLFYKVRLEFAYGLNLKRLTVSHRANNTISKAANQRAGFQFSYREPAEWLDGTNDDVLYYVLEL